MTTVKRAKRKLSDISFEQEGAHIALCHSQQGVANNQDFALVLKAKNFSDEFLEKMQQVKVTLELPDFLHRFFHLYYEDAELLARMMGYVKPEEEKEEPEDWYETYIQSKLESFEILKQANEAQDLSSVFANLEEDEYLAVLKDQERLEKAFKKIDRETKQQKESTKVVKTTAEGKPQIAGEVKVEVSTSVEVNKTKETDMTKEVKVVEQEVSVEMVEKAQFDSIQKALEDQKVALQKAMETIAQFEAEKKAQIEKARKQEVVAAVKDEAKAEVLFKAVKDASDEDFKAVVKALADLAAAVEKSDLFLEKGATVEEKTVVNESPVERLLKAKFQKQ